MFLAHTRACGEHTLEDQVVVLERGSSPRLRGESHHRMMTTAHLCSAELRAMVTVRGGADGERRRPVRAATGDDAGRAGTAERGARGRHEGSSVLESRHAVYARAMDAEVVTHQPTVTLQDVRAAAPRIRSVVKKHRGTGRVLVFGSVARGTTSRASDVDLLVEFESAASYFDLIAAQSELSDELGVPVDVMSLGARGRAADHARAQAVALT